MTKANKVNLNKININIDNTFVIFISSNLSFYLASCFLKKFKIFDYKIIFTGQGGNRKKTKDDLIFICNILNIEYKKCILIDHDYNFNYFKMFTNFKKIKNKIKNFINSDVVNYVTSSNFSLVDSLLKKLYLKKSKFFIIEDGIENWIEVNNKYNFLKSILFSFTLRTFIFIKRKRIQKNDIFVSSLKNKQYYKTSSTIDISDEFQEIINKFNKKYSFLSGGHFNILILCARTPRYKNGLDSFLLTVKKHFFKLNNKMNEHNTKFFYKPHPGYTLKSSNYNLENFTMIENDNIPIEFFDLSNFNYILSPINTSLIYIRELHNDNKFILYYYDISQSNYKKKLEIINFFNIKKFNIQNYVY